MPAEAEPARCDNRGDAWERCWSWTWYFTFNLKASVAAVSSQLQAPKDSPFRTNRTTAASIISFSFSSSAEAAADGSADIRGFIKLHFRRGHAAMYAALNGANQATQP
jgi:hypothetical protein